MFDALKNRITGWIVRPPAVIPTAEYNFGPLKRVLVRNAVVPPIGSIVFLGTADISYFGSFISSPIQEADRYEFEHCLRWQVTDVQFTLSPTKDGADLSVIEMGMSPHFQVFLAPVSVTTNLADTLPKKKEMV